MPLDVDRLNPEELQALREKLGLGDGTGRSPLRNRQLHDLRLLPTKDDPRPLFIPSAEAPRDVDTSRTFPYPRLLWTPEGIEITVHNSTEHKQRLAAGYLEVAPSSIQVEPAEAMAAELAALSPEDRALVIDMQRQERMAMLKQRLAGLSDAELSQVMATLQPLRAPQKKAG